ncbi:MAG: hypothetical protein IPM32_01875 [Ignavibacteriae bacterium]|nr:hypothetical protein [Ignavibacteriota bacterium]
MILSFFSPSVKLPQNNFSKNDVYKDLMFDRLSIENGLSQITVQAILQDSKGFLWFGTEDGLNRYDGYSFIVYRNDPSDLNSISDNFIWSIFEDSDSNLWIGTNSGGLNRYSYESNNFVHYLNDPKNSNSISENNIRTIVQYKSGNLILGTNSKGLTEINFRKNKFSQISLAKNSEKGNDANAIRALHVDKNNVLWIGTEGGGLFEFDQNKNFIKNYLSNGNINSLSSNTVWAIASLENNLWIGTYNGGLNKFDKISKKFTQINFGKSSPNLVNNNITDLVFDNAKMLWISTEGGLSLFDANQNQFINYTHDLSDLKSLSKNLTRTIFIDKSNLVWIGTVGGGINKVNINRKFKHYNHNPADEKSLSHSMIRAISEDSFGNIWIGTLGKGLNRFNKDENIFQHFGISQKNNLNLSEVNITSILEDKFGNLWVGSWSSGLYKIKFSPNSQNTRMENVQVYRNNPNNKNSISNDIIQSIFQDSKKRLWIGTENGLDVFDEKFNKVFHFTSNDSMPVNISDNRIQSKCIIEDRNGNLWIGTWRGLNQIIIPMKNNFDDFSNIKINKYLNIPGDLKSLSDSRVISLFEDKFQNSKNELIIWAGTIGGGLNKIILTEKNGNQIFDVKHFTEKDGLPNNVVYGIIGDDEGNLWLSTNNGISKFNIKTEKFKNYDTRDGLQSNQFFWGAYHKAKDGTFYFGGINGINSFVPSQLIENNNEPPVYITNCNIFPIDFPNQQKIININSFSKNKTIILPYNQYKIDIEFASLDYITPEKNLYIYYLENFDENPSLPQNANKVTYTNVTDGKYIFHVKGSNNDGVWSNKDATLTIVIETPYWKTWWFILMIVSSLAALIIYFVTTQVRNLLAVERLRTKLAADLHDNIGSSLTEISILSEVINTKLKSKDEDIVKNLNKISLKSRYLIDKMSDIVWLVNPQRDSLYDLILRLQDTYSELLADTSISFRSENLKSLEKVSLTMEHRQHLFLIFKEAINNSITHSNCSEILLNAKVERKKLEMILTDNGNGFSTNTNSENLGNGLTNMQKRAKKIGGKLLINSEVGKGTVVKYIGNIR